ncbi:unnamed protein product, partial [Prorocentrum cordatum]
MEAAAAHRAQCLRAEARVAEPLMRCSGELAQHRGRQPTRLAAALARALAESAAAAGGGPGGSETPSEACAEAL